MQRFDSEASCHEERKVAAVTSGMIDTFFLLVAAHFVADFALQSDTMAREKNPASDTALQRAVPWYWWLTAHSMVHGLAVYLITRNVTLGATEFFTHWSTDLGKCKGHYGMWFDQGVHVFVKVGYAACAC